MTRQHNGGQVPKCSDFFFIFIFFHFAIQNFFFKIGIVQVDCCWCKQSSKSPIQHSKGEQTIDMAVLCFSCVKAPSHLHHVVNPNIHDDAKLFCQYFGGGFFKGKLASACPWLVKHSWTTSPSNEILKKNKKTLTVIALQHDTSKYFLIRVPQRHDNIICLCLLTLFQFTA